MAAVAAAFEQNASTLLVLSTSSNMARLLSKYRPDVLVICGAWAPTCIRDSNSRVEGSHEERADCMADPPASRCVPLLVPGAQRDPGPQVADGCECGVSVATRRIWVMVGKGRRRRHIEGSGWWHVGGRDGGRGHMVEGEGGVRAWHGS